MVCSILCLAAMYQPISKLTSSTLLAVLVQTCGDDLLLQPLSYVQAVAASK